MLTGWVKSPVNNSRSREDDELIEKETADLIRRGVLEPSDTLYSSPFMVARAKRRSARVCVNFRKLNQYLRKSDWPLPVIEELLESARGSVYFSTLDLKKGYHQIPVEQNSRSLLGVRTKSGNYQFTVLPFGISVTVAEFQRRMDNIFEGLRGVALQLYVDDLLVHTRSEREHIVVLKKSSKS